MALTDAFLTFYRRVSRQWRHLALAGAWLMGLVGSFLVPPPFRDGLSIVHFSQFMVSALAGLIFLFVSRWNKKTHQWQWWGVSAALLILAFVGYFGDSYLRDQWIIACKKQSLIRGETYTEEAKQYRKNFKSREGVEISDQELLGDFLCDAEGVWLREEVLSRKYRIAILYVANAAVASLLLLSLTQAMNCATKRS